MHRPVQKWCTLILCLCAYRRMCKYLCVHTHPCARGLLVCPPVCVDFCQGCPDARGSVSYSVPLCIFVSACVPGLIHAGICASECVSALCPIHARVCV